MYLPTHIKSKMKNNLTSWICIFNMIYIVHCDLQGKVEMKINSTVLVGKTMFTIFDNREYVAYWKIPYAEPPLSGLRFQDPKPKRLWIEEAMSYDHSHYYIDTCETAHKEDCLYLSVFVPNSEEETENLTVLVWLHESSNLHEPDFFIEENIIVVYVSFRTGIFGFLNTDDVFARGNMGAKDVLTALRWIRENISHFGGNSDKITVMGGGNAANLAASLLVSKTSTDLYKRLIILSGSAFSPADYTHYHFEVATKLHLKLHGPFEEFNRFKLYATLRNASVDELVNASQDITDSSEVRDRQRLINSFGLSIEKNRENAFVSRHPIETYKSKLNHNNVEVILGFTSLESAYKLAGIAKNLKLLRDLNYNFQYLLPFEGRIDEYKSKRYKKIRERIKDFYFVNGTITERSLRRYIKYVSDLVIYPIWRQARWQAESSCSNVYLYRFPFRSSLNLGWLSSELNLNWSGATAGDEICYLFKCKSLDAVYNYNSESSNYRHFIKKTVRLLSNFVKDGNPTPTNEDDILGKLKWDPLNYQDGMRGLNMKKRFKMIRFPEEKRMGFWDGLKNEFFDVNDVITKDEL